MDRNAHGNIMSFSRLSFVYTCNAHHDDKRCVYMQKTGVKRTEVYVTGDTLSDGEGDSDGLSARTAMGPTVVERCAMGAMLLASRFCTSVPLCIYM